MSDQFYLYLFEDALRTYPFNNVAHHITLDDIDYTPVTISHSAPTFSSDPSQSRITVRMRDDLSVALNYISHPPPFSTQLTIYEVVETEPSGNSLLVTRYEPHWRGQVVRIAWKDSFRAVEMTCRTKQDIHFSRESNEQGLDSLCRFHLGDGAHRQDGSGCPVNIENFKETAIVVDVDADISEPTMEVSGLAQANSYYVPGMVRVGDGDMRQIEACVTAGANKLLTLSRAFPSTSVQIGDSIDVFAGDDLTQETCSVKFGSETDSGAAWGGWKLTPNRDFQRDGLG